MAASRKDYEAIADGLRRTRPSPYGTVRAIQWQHDRDAISAALHSTSGLTRNGNRSFDIDRFVAACNEGIGT